MRRNAAIMIILGMVGAACAAPDPLLEPEPDIVPAQVAVVEEVAPEPDMHSDDTHHEEGDDHVDDGHHTDEATADHADGTPHEEGDDHPAEDHHDDTVPEATEGGAFDAEVELVFSEYAIAAHGLEFAPGQTVRFHLKNDGELEHEFRLSNHHRIEEHIASGHEDHGDEEGHHGSTGDVVVLLDPGASKTVDIAFPPEADTYTVVACLLPGHYEAGMAAPIEFSS